MTPLSDSESRPAMTRTPLRPAAAADPVPVWLRHWQTVRRPRLEAGWSSFQGPHHPNNQDAVLAAAPLFAVADGVGGGTAGELASSQMLAWCQTIPSSAWREADSLQAWLTRADDVLAQSLRALNPSGLSATTFVATWVTPDGSVKVAHVGDARVLQIRPSGKGWRVECLTLDQTYSNMGEMPPPGGNHNDPARMVGVGAMGIPPVRQATMSEGDVLLLCSDGFHRFVGEAEIATRCARAASQHKSLAELADELGQAARSAGSQDDISVLLVRRNPRWGARAAWWSALALALAGAWAFLVLL